MDPITITAVSTLLSYWCGKAFDKAFETATGEFTKDSVKWLKSVFFEDSKPNEVLERFEQKPESLARQSVIKAAIVSELEDHPEAKKYLIEIVKVIEAKSGRSTVVSNSKNVNTASINSGRDVIVGDNNQIS